MIFCCILNMSHSVLTFIIDFSSFHNGLKQLCGLKVVSILRATLWKVVMKCKVVMFFNFLGSRYHREMKTRKILASNSKHFRIYGTFNKWQIGVPRLTFQILLFLRSILLQTASGRENSPGYIFWLKKSKSDIKFVLKDTACPKM